MVWDFLSNLGSFFLRLKPKNIQNAAIFTLFITLFLTSIILISLGVKFPSNSFEKWVAQDNTTDTYYCSLYLLNSIIECNLKKDYNIYAIISISHTQDKAIISIYQPEYYTIQQGINAYKGYEYSDGKIKIIVNDVGPTQGVNLKIVPLTKVFNYLVLAISIIGMGVIYFINKKDRIDSILRVTTQSQIRASDDKRNKHFEELKNEVLKPWSEDLFNGVSIFNNDDGVCDIKICESHRIKKVLFKDLKNHFLKLVGDYDKLKQKYKIHKIECKNFSNDLLKKMNAKPTIWLSKLIYYKLTSKDTSDMEPRIENNRLCGGGYTYAEGNEQSLSEILLNLKMIVKSKTLKRKAKQISKNELTLKKQAEKFSENLQKTIHLQTLDGSCEFLK